MIPALHGIVSSGGAINALSPLSWRFQTHAWGSNTPRYLYQDGAMTVAATIAGETVAAAQDPITGLKVFDFANGPTLQFVNSVPVLRFNGSNQYGVRDGRSLSGAHAFVRFIQRVPTYGGGILSDSNASSLDQTNPNGTVIETFQMELPSGHLNRDCPTVLVTRRIYHDGAGGISQFVEGVPVRYIASGAAIGASTLTLLGCRNVFGPTDFNGIDVEAVYAGNNLTTGQVDAINVLICPRQGAFRVVCCGTSITRGNNAFVGTLIGETYPDQLQSLRPTDLVLNIGIWGNTIGGLTAQIAELNAMYISGAHIHVDIGTNDLAATSMTAATLRTQVNTFVSAMKTTGYTVGLCTILPRTDAGVVAGDFNTKKGTYNTGVTSDPSPADYAIDWAGIAGMADSDDLAKYLDKVHPTVAGNALLAAENDSELP